MADVQKIACIDIFVLLGVAKNFCLKKLGVAGSGPMIDMWYTTYVNKKTKWLVLQEV